MNSCKSYQHFPVSLDYADAVEEMNGSMQHTFKKHGVGGDFTKNVPR